MKNLKRFGELDEEKIRGSKLIGVNAILARKNAKNPNEEALHEFNEACEHFDFFGAFEIAQDKGLFGGDFEEYMESRKRAGGGPNGAYQKMIKLYDEYVKVAFALKDLIISDIEGAQEQPEF